MLCSVKYKLSRSREMCYGAEDCKSWSLPQELEPLHCGNNNRLLDWGFLLKTPSAHNISSTRTLHCWFILGHIRPPKVNPLFKAWSENMSTLLFGNNRSFSKRADDVGFILSKSSWNVGWTFCLPLVSLLNQSCCQFYKDVTNNVLPRFALQDAFCICVRRNVIWWPDYFIE